MARRDGHDAQELANRYGFRLGENFFSLGTDTVSGILAGADEWRYRKPKNANGSRARYFYQYLNRLAKR